MKTRGGRSLQEMLCPQPKHSISAAATSRVPVLRFLPQGPRSKVNERWSASIRQKYGAEANIRAFLEGVALIRLLESSNWSRCGTENRKH